MHASYALLAYDRKASGKDGNVSSSPDHLSNRRSCGGKGAVGAENGRGGKLTAKDFSQDGGVRGVKIRRTDS
jgi:hypothetical protein